MLEKLIKKLAKALDAEKIPYMIIGGQAVLLYGSPRLCPALFRKKYAVPFLSEATAVPRLLRGVEWEEVKKFFEREIKELNAV